jgi:hypothetical protein
MAATRIFCWLEAGGVEASQGSQVCDSSVYAGQREGLTNLRLRDYIYIFGDFIFRVHSVTHMTMPDRSSLPRLKREP